MFTEKDLIFTVPDGDAPALFSGKFARRVLVVTAAQSDHPDTLPFLSKVLAAAQINLEQDTLLAQLPAGAAIGLASLLKKKQPVCVLVFGLPPQALCLAIQPAMYQLFEFYGCSWLWADDLAGIEQDKNRKAHLWRALQQLFLK